MNEKAIVKKLMEEQGVTATKLANRLGISQQACWDRLNGKGRGLTVDVLVNMLAVLDCKLVVLPITAKIPSGGTVIEKRGEE